MSIGVRKAALGTVLTLVFAAIAAPVALWFASGAVDKAIGLHTMATMPISMILAAAAILIGVFWISWAHSYLLFVGKGIPQELFGWAIHPTRILVTTGPYAYTRNPMTLGLGFILLGVALLRGSIGGLILIAVLALITAIYLVIFEEKALSQRFGPRYQHYQHSVPLLIPRFSAYAHMPEVRS